MLEPPSHRSSQDCSFSAEIMKEENLFPEFHNNINVLTCIAQLMRGRLLTPGETLLDVGNKERSLYKLVAGQAKVTRNGQSKLKSRN